MRRISIEIRPEQCSETEHRWVAVVKDVLADSVLWTSSRRLFFIQAYQDACDYISDLDDDGPILPGSLSRIPTGLHRMRGRPDGVIEGRMSMSVYP